jgi:hypothetical protein
MSGRAGRGGGSGSRSIRKLALLTVTILVALAVVQVLRSRSSRPDPHFVAAKQMIDGYERGRNRAERNYRHSVYTDALSELKRVNPHSISAEPAAALRVRIRTDRMLFEQRGKSSRRNRAAAVEDRRARANVVAAGHVATDLRPPETYPECEESSEDSDP